MFVLGAAAALMLAALLGYSWLIDRIFEGMCANRISAEYPSPDGLRRAVVFERDCGATTGFSAQVSVLRRGEILGNEGGNVCVVEADGDTPDDINAEISVSWAGPKELVIHSMGISKRTETDADGVTISYR